MTLETHSNYIHIYIQEKADFRTSKEDQLQFGMSVFFPFLASSFSILEKLERLLLFLYHSND